MYLFIEPNPNCDGEERVFAANGPIKKVARIQWDRPGVGLVWCEVVGLEENGTIAEASAQRVDDSADGTAWLVFGGAWGLRFRSPGTSQNWDIADQTQWGLPFLVLDSGGKEIEFKKETT